MSEHVILLDMDGVIANFVRHSLVANDLLLRHDDCTQYDYWKLAGISGNQFWKRIDSTPRFWETIPPYPWFLELKKIVSQFDFHICTSPSKSPDCFSGKADWIQAYFGREFRNIVLTPQKHLLAKSNHILIDDSQQKYEKFVDAGGHAILFPQPWNSNSHLTDDRIAFVRDQLDAIVGFNKR